MLYMSIEYHPVSSTELVYRTREELPRGHADRLMIDHLAVTAASGSHLSWLPSAVASNLV